MGIRQILTVALLAVSMCASAANVDSIVAGDIYYLWRPDGPNLRVTVREVDRQNQRVKVALPDNEIKWVAASELKTRDEASSNDIALGVGAIALAGLYCAVDPEACKSKPTQAPAPSAAGISGGFKVINQCRHPVKIAIHYRDTANRWNSDGWWEIAGGATNYLANSSNQILSTTASTWYFYAETTDDTDIVWKGDTPHNLGSFLLPMKQMEDKEGDSEWVLRCDPQAAKSEKGGVPQFRDYPVSSAFIGAHAAVKLSSSEERAFRTRLREAVKQPANFAGEYVLTTWGCGTDCVHGAVVSRKTGRVVFLPGSMCCWEGEGERLEFRLNSRLLVAGGIINEESEHGAHFYEFTGQAFKHLKTVPIAR